MVEWEFLKWFIYWGSCLCQSLGVHVKASYTYSWTTQKQVSARAGKIKSSSDLGCPLILSMQKSRSRKTQVSKLVLRRRRLECQSSHSLPSTRWTSQCSRQWNTSHLIYLCTNICSASQKSLLKCWGAFKTSSSWEQCEICCCSVASSCSTLCSRMDCSTPGSYVLHYLPEFSQINVHWVSDAI